MADLQLPQRLKRFPEYIFSRLAKAVIETENGSGRKVLNLGIGSPDVPPSEIYLSKFSEFIREPGAHLYPGYSGTKEFNDALAGWYRERFGVELEENEVFPLMGAKDGIAHIPFALLDEDDEVLLPDPGYQGFEGPTLIAGGIPVPYDASSEENPIPFAELEAKVTKRTRYIWVNFPSNPTGYVADLSLLEKVVNFARKHNLVVIYDNAYSEITFDGFRAPSILQINGAKNNAVEMGSFTKTFSFAGLRMGWIAGNKNVINALAKVKSQMDSGMFLPLQRLGAFALAHQDKEWHKQMIASYQKRRDIIAEKLKALGLSFSLPKAALYIWAKIPDSAPNCEAFCIDLLRKKQVLLTPGTAFGKNGERYVRVSICANVDNINEYL